MPRFDSIRYTPPCRTPASLTVRGLDDLQGAPGSGEFENGGEEYEDQEEEAFFDTDDGDEEDEEGGEDRGEEDPFETPADEVELLGEFVLEGEVRTAAEAVVFIHSQGLFSRCYIE